MVATTAAVDVAGRLTFAPLCSLYAAGGSSGAVYRGTYMGADVAIKTLSTNPDMMEKATAMLAAETKAIGNINHPNIVELIGILLDPPLTCVVLEVRACPRPRLL